MCPGVSSADCAENTPIKTNIVAKYVDFRLNGKMDDKLEAPVVSLRYCDIGFQSYSVICFR